MTTLKIKLGLVISNAIALHVRYAQFGKLVEPTHPNDEVFDGIMTGPADEPTIDDLPTTAAVPDDNGPTIIRGCCVPTDTDDVIDTDADDEFLLPSLVLSAHDLTPDTISIFYGIDQFTCSGSRL